MKTKSLLNERINQYQAVGTEANPMEMEVAALK